LTLNNPLDSTTDAPGHPSPDWPWISEFEQARELLSATDNTNVKVLAHDVILPSCVEEPSIPDVKMRTSSWYEPEPDRTSFRILTFDKLILQYSLGIVVTDLDSFSDDDDDESAELDTSSISISRPLLERLASHAKKLIDPPPPSSSQALVLYRPLRHGAVTDDSKSNEGMIGTTVSEVIGEDNSMEVDPW
jgi:hypothetical protein